eukprot:3021742-Amphidinium_carterae.1
MSWLAAPAVIDISVCQALEFHASRSELTSARSGKLGLAMLQDGSHSARSENRRNPWALLGGVAPKPSASTGLPLCCGVRLAPCVA